MPLSLFLLVARALVCVCVCSQKKGIYLVNLIILPTLVVLLDSVFSCACRGRCGIAKIITVDSFEHHDPLLFFFQS